MTWFELLMWGFGRVSSGGGSHQLALTSCGMAGMAGMGIDCNAPSIDSTGDLISDKAPAAVVFLTDQFHMTDLGPVMIALQVVAQGIYDSQKRGAKDY
jgi:hypothetical protein